VRGKALFPLKRWSFILLVTMLIFLPTLLPSTRAQLGSLAFSVALSPVGDVVVGQVFARAAPLLPVEKLLVNPLALVFEHPHPSWETHYLIVPRSAIKDIFTLLEPEHKKVLETVLSSIQRSLNLSKLKPPAYSLTVNGGLRQDVKQVHFHLNGERGAVAPLNHLPDSQALVLQTATYTVFNVTTAGGLHLIILPREPQPALSNWQTVPAYLVEHPLPLTELEAQFDLTARGFSVVLQELSSLESAQLIIHVTAGELTMTSTTD